jgi:CelD/BcsL family acetyltransferase involved in cellulose biosynthesis
MTLAPKPHCHLTEACAFRVTVEPHFEFRSDEYRSLHDRSHTSAFQEPGWLDTLHRMIVPAMAADPFTIVARDRTTNRLLLVLPLVRRRRKGVTFLEFADFAICDYLCPVYDPADAPLLLADEALPERVGDLLPRCDVIRFTKLIEGDPVLAHLFPNARRARMGVSTYPANIGTSWSDWRSTKLNHGFRRYLNLKRRRATRAGEPSFVLVQDATEIARIFDALRKFRADRFRKIGTDDVLTHETIFLSYRRVAIDGAQNGTARTFCLYLSNEPIAVIFGLVHRRTFYLILVGFDAARYARLSPGLLAIEDTMRASFEAGDTVYDFTIGDHDYKLQFGAQAVPLHEWQIARTIRGQIAMHAIRALRWAKAYAQGTAPCRWQNRVS